LRAQVLLEEVHEVAVEGQEEAGGVHEGGLLDVGDDEVVVAGAGAGGAVGRGEAGEGVEAVDGGCEGYFLGGGEVCPAVERVVS
jgi:hypothetical protein